MASLEADNLKDKFLTCVICKCLYKDPATLQCGHSYCRKCLTSYIQLKPDSIRNKVIPCSMRCEGTRVPNPQKPVSLEADNLKDKFLTCVICKCLYEDPATLQCGHSYCRTCLTSYIQSKPDYIRNKVIPCSMRCEGTRVPNPQKPVETWAAQIRPSLVIRNLLDEYKQMTDQPNAIDVHTQRFIQCEDHSGKLQDLICEDHQKVICMKCWGHKHRHCKSVVPLETKVEEIQPDIVNYKSKLNVAIEHQMVRIATCRSDVDTLGSIEKDTQYKIQQTFKKLVDVVKVKESSLLQKLKSSITSENQNNQKMEESRLQVYQQRSRLINEAEKSRLLSDIYNIYQSCLSPEASNGKIDISQSSYRAVRDVVFSVNTDQLIERINKLDFGTLDIKYEIHTDVIDSPSAACCSSSGMVNVSTDNGDKLTNSVGRNALSHEHSHGRQKGSSAKKELFRSPVLADTVQCQLPNDNRDTELCDVTVLDIDGIQVIAVTDWCNSCVKSFYTSNNKTCHSKLHLDDRPWGITQWQEHHIMVAAPLSYMILTVAVTPDLVLLSTISTSKRYYSLAVLGPSRLAAGRYSSDCVDILNIEGQVMKSVSTYNNVRLFFQPWYMCINNKNNLLVSDWGKETVTCLTSEGVVVWVYAPTGYQRLQRPEGIQWTPEGILLVDKDSHKVILLTESGQYVRDVLTEQDGLFNPVGICVDKDNSLFVCCRNDVKHFKFT